MSIRIVIDPGHGGSAPVGGSTPYGGRGPRGTVEKDLTLALAHRLAARFGGAAALTRTHDVNVALGTRAALARAHRAPVFLSLHAGGSVQAEAWVHERAGTASRALAHSLGMPVYAGPLAVIDPRAHAPNTAACLVEVDFASDLDATADALYRGISARLGDAADVCPWWLAEQRSDDYLEYAQRQTWGTARLLINGLSSGGAGPDVPRSEPFDMMQHAVEGTNPDDAVYLASWMFDPTTELTRRSSSGDRTWGDLIARRANDGVTFRIILNDFPAISSWHSNLEGLDELVLALPQHRRDRVKYLLSRHPAHLAAPDWLVLMSRGKVPAGDQYIATHHQKFMLVRHRDHLVAFCGGVDIIPGMTPARWSRTKWKGWHDLQVQLEGPITRDLEKEFAWRWNRERHTSRRRALPGWAPFEELRTTPLSGVEQMPGVHRTAMQMLRTVSESNGRNDPANFVRPGRDDVRQSYRHGIGCAHQFLYLENQYFRSTELADWIVARAAEQPGLIVMFVVVDGAMATADDGSNPITDKGMFLQHQAFDRIARALGPSRVRFYTMHRRYVHSKLILADDTWCCIGSANVNPRSFQMDSELNVQIREPNPEALLGLRKTLWSHNLGIDESSIATWSPSEFFARWDAVAAANARKLSSWREMQGEGILRYDYTRWPGVNRAIVPDLIVDLGPGETDPTEQDTRLAGAFGQVSRMAVFNPGDTHWEILGSNRPIEEPRSASAIRFKTTVNDYDGWQHTQMTFTFTDETLGVEVAINATADTRGMLRGADVGPYVRHCGASATVVRAGGAFIDASVGWGRTPESALTWVRASWDDDFACARLDLPIEIRVSAGARSVVARRVVTFWGNGEKRVDFALHPHSR